MEAAIEDEPAIVDESTLHFGRQLNSKKVFESNPLTFLYVWSRCIYAISGESPQNAFNSGLGIIVICPDEVSRFSFCFRCGVEKHPLGTLFVSYSETSNTGEFQIHVTLLGGSSQLVSG